MRTLGIALLFAIACLAGLITSELFWRSPACREVLARFSGRGELRALVGGVGIYQDETDDDVKGRVVAENLRRVSRDEYVESAEIEREISRLRRQFGDEKAFDSAMESSGSSVASLQADATEHLCGRQWIEKQITAAVPPTEEECRQFYEANREQFMQPQRFRASHLFLAAPEGTPPEVISLKEKGMKAFAARIAKGEALAALASEASEDEATKLNGGDLGFFSAARLPPEFIGAIEKLRIGQVSVPIRTHLGFHIAQLTDVKPPRELTFEEARREIALRLTNDKRATAVGDIVARLSVAEFIRAER